MNVKCGYCQHSILYLGLGALDKRDPVWGPGNIIVNKATSAARS